MIRCSIDSVARRFVLALFIGAGFAAWAQSPPTLAVDVSNGRYPINPNIYGIANYGLDTTFAQEIKVPNIRWGGDGTTRYNWEVDSSNSGFDWYFTGGNGETNPVPGASVDTMIKSYPTAGALITIPIIPYVNKTSAWNCSFPVSVYGAQQATNPYIHPNGDNCGNSIATNGTQLLDTNIYANHIDNTTALQQSWVQHLVATFGTAAQGGVPFYQLDNEPYGWGNTHRDIEPNGADYPTITQLGQQYAAVVKQVDPTAMVLGPSDFTLGGWVGKTSEQNGLLAAQYYLQQMAAYEQANGTRILDYLDEHYYPEFTDQTSQLASTRTFWDPTYNGGTWVEQYVFNGPMQLLPRMQGWVSQYYPGTKISISEYSIDSGNKTIVDALAEMDVLGIFGRQQLDFANMWNTPAPTDPIAYAFRMYRDYDGNGAQYGDTWVSATSSNQAQLSVYAAQRSTDNVITILVINKTTGTISTSLQVANTTLPASASVYTYTGANLNQIANAANAAISNGSISYSFPAYSATLFAFAPASAPLGTTSTALTASATQLTVGQSVTLTAAVSGTDSPTGSVTFSDGSTALGSATLVSGKAALSTSGLGAGTHSITVMYGGDANNATSTSSALTITVSQPTLPATITTLSSSATQINIGQNITFTALVSGSSPTGSVNFLDGTTALGRTALSGIQAAFTTTSLAAGAHSITAVYSGDADNAASTSSARTVTVTQPTQSLATTITTLGESATQVNAGQAVNLTATVASTAGTPTGTVTFNNGSSSLGSASLAGGVATLSLNGLAAATYAVSARYGGDATDMASTSAAVNITVTPVQVAPSPSFQLALAQNTLSVAAGSSGQINLSISPENGFSSTVQLTCTGLPMGAACNFSPASLTPAGPDPSTLTITTTPNAALYGSLLFPPMLTLLFARRKRRLKAIFVTASVLLLLAGCGVTVTNSSNGTPAGTYTVQVVATAGSGQTESQQLILTVH